MSQNMINDLTERVSALTADVARLEAQRNDLLRVIFNEKNARAVAEARASALDEVMDTAEGLLGENKRLKAEVEALSDELASAIYECGTSSSAKARQEVEEIKIEARNDVARLEAEILEVVLQAQGVIEQAERRMYDAMNERDAAKAAGAEVIQTAEGLQDENKRLKAEVRDLTKVATVTIWALGAGTSERAAARVEEIKINARNNI